MSFSPKIRKIAWITSTLNAAGGGPRLLLEGVEYYRKQGIDVLVITWDFNEQALFDGRYSNHNIYEIGGSQGTGGSLTFRAIRRLKTVWQLRKKVKEFGADVIFNQSEYDAALLKLALIGHRYKMASFVFGQMFQFPLDLTKYALPFSKHLDEIRNSTPGYRRFVPEKRPPVPLRDIALVQIIALPRFFGIRSSIAVFVFSKQVQWEVSKLYGVSSHILKGAFPRALIGQKLHYDASKFSAKPGERIILSLSRLVEKKRIDLKIEALSILINERGVKDLRLVVGGSGPEFNRLLELVNTLKLQDHVTFLGYVPEEEVYALTASCDVFASLDVADFDISPYEALALKRRIVWSSEMDMDEYLETCGAVFPVEPTPGDVADGIERALVQKEEKINWKGRERYSWEIYFDSIFRILNAAV